MHAQAQSAVRVAAGTPLPSDEESTVAQGETVVLYCSDGTLVCNVEEHGRWVYMRGQWRQEKQEKCLLDSAIGQPLSGAPVPLLERAPLLATTCLALVALGDRDGASRLTAVGLTDGVWRRERRFQGPGGESHLLEGPLIWKSCIVPWWTSLSVRRHLPFCER